MLWENVVPALKSPGYYDALTTLWGYDIRDRLEEIGVPTLIVWGRNDRVVPVPAALSYKKRIGENAELVIFDHCGHVPQIERPVRFNRVLERFLAREGVLATEATDRLGSSDAELLRSCSRRHSSSFSRSTARSAPRTAGEVPLQRRRQELSLHGDHRGGGRDPG